MSQSTTDFLTSLPKEIRPTISALRGLVLSVSKSDAAIGDLTETLKWGQLAFLPKKPRVGTTVRMDMVSEDPPRVALYFHCQTSLVETYRELYADDLNFEGNRAIILDASRPLPEDVLRHCLHMALTYHKAKKGKAA